ncbi:MAG: SIMPL domain-containing protein [Devosiaceae bacterium]|nr:SIMPL domain-containing protein [Devosiaceae bacterium]
MRHFIPIALLSALLFSAPALAQIIPGSGTISLTGTGEVAGKPDMAIISSGVVTHGETARMALDANTQAMGRIFEVLQNENVELHDIQTSGFSVQPQYIYSDQRDENGYPLPPRISGYQVANTLTVRVRDLESLGTLLDTAVSVGSNQINSISFAVSNTAPLLNDARRAAMQDAIQKAQLYAEAAGVGLGNILNISEAGVVFAPPPQMAMMATMEMDARAVPIAAGELNFTKQITVIWQLVQE